MTRIEYFTTVEHLSDFLDLVQSDGLQAKGCSLDLLLPQNETSSWEDWLNEEVIDAAEVSDEIMEMRRAVDAAALNKKGTA